MKYTKIITLAVLALGITLTSGCFQPVEPKVLEIAKSNETMFVIPLVGENKNAQVKLNSEEYYAANKVSMREYQLPHRWLNRGKHEWTYDGEWIPTVQVIKVDRTPVTCAFAVNDKTKAKNDADAIWVESADSVGFSMGFSVSAMINPEDAARFLYRYPASSLATVVNTEVRARIQSVAADFSSKFILDNLRSKKADMLQVIKDDVVPFFKDRGITITTIGQFGGMTYENTKIQEAIDEVFIKQQEKEKAAALLAAQKDINAKNESAAQQDRANAITLATGEAEAIRLKAEATAKGNLLKSQADAKGIEAIALATKEAASNPLFLKVRELEVQTQMYSKWNGNVPQTVIAGGGVTPNIFLPTNPNTQVSQFEAAAASVTK